MTSFQGNSVTPSESQKHTYAFTSILYPKLHFPLNLDNCRHDISLQRLNKIQNLSLNEEFLYKFVFFNSINVKRVGNFQGLGASFCKLPSIYGLFLCHANEILEILLGNKSRGIDKSAQWVLLSFIRLFKSKFQ